MKTANVSFGKVIAVYGNQNKIKKINDKLKYKVNPKQIMMKDVTSSYIYSASDGLLSTAAKQGDTVEIYITGNDVGKVNKEPKWKTIEGILSHLYTCYDAAKMSVNDIVDIVVKG